jgi:hypothetical protein
MIRFEEVLERLLPDVEWVCYGSNLEGLTIFNESIEKPTQAKIDKALKEIVMENEKAKIDASTKRAEVLTRLGITSEEAALLLS